MELKGNKAGILIDLDRCVGCFACEVACRQENMAKEDGKKNIRMIEIGPKTVEGKLLMDYFPILSIDCTLCRQRLQKDFMPACVASCPTKALLFGGEYDILNLLNSGKRIQISKIIEF
jgi:anaerobic dimethyl sulfoxide reductase subunit B (iron-sulfur subunit)